MEPAGEASARIDGRHRPSTSRPLKEIRRICALPEPERKAELERIGAESGIVVYCGNE